jgi:hypothetical protein
VVNEKKVAFLFGGYVLLCKFVGDNGSVLAEVGDFRAETVRLPQKHHRSTRFDFSSNAPILANTCYQQPFYQLVINSKNKIECQNVKN